MNEFSFSVKRCDDDDDVVGSDLPNPLRFMKGKHVYRRTNTLQYFGYFNNEVYSYIPDEVITLNVFYYLENINGYFFRSVVVDDDDD